MVIGAHVRGKSIQELAGELCAAVGDVIIRYAVPPDHVFNIFFSKFWSANIFVAGEVDRHLSHSADDYENLSVYCCL
jgi:hypothetical protein